jgi:hypothetical protein
MPRQPGPAIRKRCGFRVQHALPECCARGRASCSKATANQFRSFLHAGAYWLLWSLRALMPRASSWRVVQFDTLTV